MIPIENVALVLLVAFGFVGLGRSLGRELGATTGYVGLLLGLEILGDRVGTVATQGLSVAGFPVEPDMAAWIAYTLAIAATVYFVYQGETLSFNSAPLPGPLGKVLDLGVGLLNGWLVVGGWWYYTDRLAYPIQRAGLFIPPLSLRAERLVGLTPLALVPADRAVLYLGAALAVLVFMKVAR